MNTARTLSVISLVMGALSAGIVGVTGCCCGGWLTIPLAIVSIVCGIIAIVNGDSRSRTFALIGISLSVIMHIVRISA